MADEKLSTLFWELEIRLARAEAAERAAREAGQRTGQAFDDGAQLNTKGAKAASEWVASLAKDLQNRREDIKREAVAGLITAKEAAAAGRAAAASFTQELRGGLVALREKGVITNAQFPALLGQGADALRLNRVEAERLAYQLNSVEKATTVAGGSLLRIRGPLTQLATSAIGARSNVGQLASSLALLGVGATATLAITLGVGAIAFAYNKITESAREAKKKLDELFTSLAKIREQGKPETTIAKARLDAASGAVAALEKRIRELEQPVVGGDRDIAGKEAARSAEILRVRNQLRTATRGMADAQIALTQAQNDEAEASASRLARLVLEGHARKDQIALRKVELEQARAALALLNDTESQAGRSRRTQVRRAAPDSKDAVLDEQLRLSGIIKSLEAVDKAEAKSDDRREKAGERAAKAAEVARSKIEQVRLAGAALLAAQTPTGGDNLESQIARFVKQAEDANDAARKAKQPLIDIAAAVSLIRDAASKTHVNELARELRDLSASATVSAVDNLQNSLADLIEAMREKGASQELIDQVTALQQPMIDATGAAEELQKALEEIDRSVSQGFDLKGNLAKLRDLIDKATKARDAAKPGTVAQESAQKRLNELIAKEAEILRQIQELREKAAKQTQSIATKTGEVAGEIAKAANAAYGLASAFLGVDSNITKALGSIGQLASGIEGLSKAKSFSDFLSSAGLVVGGALALGQVLGIGQSPEEKERLARLKENTEAIRRLTNRVGDLGKDITGSRLGAVRQALSDPRLDLEKLRRVAAFRPFDFSSEADKATDQLSRALGKILSELGLSFKDLAEVAHELGIEIDKDRIQFEDVQAVMEAITRSELGQFADDFAGQMAQLNAEFEVFDITDPIEQFKRLLKAINGVADGGGILAETLAGVDTSTAEGIADAITRLQGLFTQITSGAIDPTQFGGLTGQETIDAILKALELLRSTPAGQTAGGTGGFNTVRTITEVTGSRIGALLSTANIFAEMTAANTKLIAERLGGDLSVTPTTEPTTQPLPPAQPTEPAELPAPPPPQPLPLIPVPELPQLTIDEQELKDAASTLGKEINRAIDDAAIRVDVEAQADAIAPFLESAGLTIDQFEKIVADAGFQVFDQFGRVVPEVLQQFTEHVNDAVTALFAFQGSLSGQQPRPPQFDVATADTLRDALADLVDRVTAVAVSPPPPISDLLSTGNTFAERTAINTARIAELLSSETAPGALSPQPTPVPFLPSPFTDEEALAAIIAQRSKILSLLSTPVVPPVSPPSLVPQFAGAASTVINVSLAPGTVQVTLQGPMTEDDATEVGERLSRNMTREINRALGNELSWQHRANGYVVRT
jgi:hypothetical protein